MTQKTALYDEHVKLGGTIVDFAGWELPVYYTRVIEEHEATRERAGLYDIGHMGEFELTGAGVLDFLQHVLSRELKSIVPGFAMYSTMLHPTGGTVDDLFVYCKAADCFMIVVNAANTEKDFEWMKSHAAGYDVKFEDKSGMTSKIDLQGPMSKKIMERLTAGADLPERFHFKEGEVAGVKTLISRTGYTGEDGFELYCDNSVAPKLWNAILEEGKPEGVVPCGLGARDSLRLECCYSLYGHELTDTISPVEAGLAFVVAKEKDYIGGDVVKAQQKEGAPRKLIVFELVERGIPREHYEVSKDGAVIGEVTSGTYSPTLKKGIGMALVTKGAAAVGDTITVSIRNKPYEAKVVKRPFISFRGGE
ncbi:MAG: glycine cleavage system aminomethyltransferase GcvT, partial [bacterium]